MKRLFFFCVCVTALMAGRVEAYSYGKTPVVEVEFGKIQKFLPSKNEALDKALAAHNLLYRLPEIQKLGDVMRTMSSATDKMQRYFDTLMKCNEQRFSGRFKNPRTMVNVVRKAYEEKVASLPLAKGNPDSIVPESIAQKDEQRARKRQIEEDLMNDVFKNGKKWGGEIVDRSSGEAPKSMVRNTMVNAFEELSNTAHGLQNARLGQEQVVATYKKLETDFSRQLDGFGLNFPDLDLTKGAQVLAVRKALKELKKQYLEEAKQYVVRLNEQDASYPELVAQRAARSVNKQRIMARMQEQFPDVFNDLQEMDQQTPQQAQQLLISALERDVEGSVYLTQTNAVEVDQRMAEARSNHALSDEMAQKAFASFEENIGQGVDNFDFDMCKS